MPEMLDVYDDNMRHQGTMTREEAHRTGAWHKTFHCWIVRRDREGQFVLFQRRSASKKAHPNKLDITAAGHLEAGETVEASVREVAEELGVSVDISELKFLGIRTAASISGEGINREFNHVFLLHRDSPIEEYVLQDTEVSGLVQIELSEGLSLCAGRQEFVRATGVQRENGQVDAVDLRVSLKDIIPRRDFYYMKIFIMAQRFFAGAADICI